MRLVTIRLIAIGFLALGASAQQPRAAQACLKFDRAAEMALIDQAIASDKTPEADKATLRTLRKEMDAYRNKTTVDTKDIVENHRVTTAALKLIGKERIVWNGPPDLDVGVFKHTKSAKPNRETRAAKTVEVPAGAAVPACG